MLLELLILRNSPQEEACLSIINAYQWDIASLPKLIELIAYYCASSIGTLQLNFIRYGKSKEWLNFLLNSISFKVIR